MGSHDHTEDEADLATEDEADSATEDDVEEDN